MKKLGLLLMLLLAMTMQSHRVFAQSVTITLMPGWNWISVPLMDTLDFQTAMGSVTPVDGDIIKSHWGSAAYSNGQWRGTISQFYPGYGYHYKSNRTMPVFLTFTAQQPNPQGDDHEYVDLGLPSGALWATCNVGASTPEEYGDYFAWGETQPKTNYCWSTYQYCNGSENTLTRYCFKSNFGYNGFVDNLTVLLQEDDAATANWGNDWRIPTKEEWEELYDNTTCTWITQNGVNGWLFTAINDNSIFLPAAGYRSHNDLYDAGSNGNYWLSSLDINNTNNPSNAWQFYFGSDLYYLYGSNRCNGRSIRPVRSASQSNAPIGTINGKFSVGDNVQVYFSQGNLQYQASTNTWRFAENQWDYIGESNTNISSYNNGWIDLFGWGTSGYNHGAVCYQPWSVSIYNNQFYAYGNANYNLNDQSGQADWGYNAISNGGNTTNTWRTLTVEEWDYLFNTRNTVSGIRFVKAKVNEINGVILLPDNWINVTYSFSNVNQDNSSYDNNIITQSVWTNTFEVKGAVF